MANEKYNIGDKVGNCNILDTDRDARNKRIFLIHCQCGCDETYWVRVEHLTLQRKRKRKCKRNRLSKHINSVFNGKLITDKLGDCYEFTCTNCGEKTKGGSLTEVSGCNVCKQNVSVKGEHYLSIIYNTLKTRAKCDTTPSKSLFLEYLEVLKYEKGDYINLKDITKPFTLSNIKIRKHQFHHKYRVNKRNHSGYVGVEIREGKDVRVGINFNGKTYSKIFHTVEDAVYWRNMKIDEFGLDIPKQTIGNKLKPGDLIC